MILEDINIVFYQRTVSPHLTNVWFEQPEGIHSADKVQERKYDKIGGSVEKVVNQNAGPVSTPQAGLQDAGHPKTAVHKNQVVVRSATEDRRRIVRPGIQPLHREWIAPSTGLSYINITVIQASRFQSLPHSLVRLNLCLKESVVRFYHCYLTQVRQGSCHPGTVSGAEL